MENNSCNYPNGDAQILLFWSYMLRALRNMGSRKLELFMMEDVVASALALDETDRWTINHTFDEFPRLCAHLPLVTLSVGKILYLQRRLMIALHPDDKAKLEAKNDIIIKTSNNNYVISWKKNEKEKKDGEAGKKEEKTDGESAKKKEKKVTYGELYGDMENMENYGELREREREYGESDGMRSAEREEVAEKEEVAEEGVIEKMTGDDVMKKKKNEKKKMAKGNPDEMKRGRFTKDEEDRMVCYVVETIKKNSVYGLKSNKMSTADAWTEFWKREGKINPEKKKSPGSYETHFRRQLKPKFFSFDSLSPEDRLLIGKTMGVKMTPEAICHFQKEYHIKIEIKNELIVDWKFQGISTN